MSEGSSSGTNGAGLASWRRWVQGKAEKQQQWRWQQGRKSADGKLPPQHRYLTPGRCNPTADKNPIGRVACIALDTWRRGSANRPPTSTITRGNRGGTVKNKITHAQSNQSQKVGPTARHVPSKSLTWATKVIQVPALTSSRLCSGELRLF